MPQIDADRFLRDLNELRQIGAYKTGVHRPTYSPDDMESRRWLMARMAEIGLEPAIDGIGNVYGRHPGPGPHLLAGSHIETQNYAGWLDGALGVVAGLVLGFVFLFFRQSIVDFVQLVTGQNLWDPSIRFLTELPSKTDPVEVTTIALMALVFSFLATLYPAFKAASTDPVQVLRYE